jgi:hypothetical protein
MDHNPEKAPKQQQGRGRGGERGQSGGGGHARPKPNAQSAKPERRFGKPKSDRRR